MVTGKPVYRFHTGNRFSEHMAGYRIDHTSRRQDPGNADADASRVGSARRFLAIPASSATSEHLFWRMVDCRLVSFTSAAPIHGQSCIPEWKYVTE